MTCTWCGHEVHAGPCEQTIAAGVLTGHTGLHPLPRRYAGPKGETVTISCPCARGGVL